MAFLNSSILLLESCSLDEIPLIPLMALVPSPELQGMIERPVPGGTIGDCDGRVVIRSERLLLSNVTVPNGATVAKSTIVVEAVSVERLEGLACSNVTPA